MMRTEHGDKKQRGAAEHGDQKPRENGESSMRACWFFSEPDESEYYADSHGNTCDGKEINLGFEGIPRKNFEQARSLNDATFECPADFARPESDFERSNAAARLGQNRTSARTAAGVCRRR